MNAYLITQLPLVGGFIFLLFLASIRPFQKESASTFISVIALCASAAAIWLFLPEGDAILSGVPSALPR
jgi:hypothetical protein